MPLSVRWFAETAYNKYNKHKVAIVSAGYEYHLYPKNCRDFRYVLSKQYKIYSTKIFDDIIYINRSYHYRRTYKYDDALVCDVRIKAQWKYLKIRLIYYNGYTENKKDKLLFISKNIDDGIDIDGQYKIWLNGEYKLSKLSDGLFVEFHPQKNKKIEITIIK